MSAAPPGGWDGGDADFSPVAEVSDWRFAPVAALYEAAFPASERKPPAFLREVIERDDYALLASSAGGELLGFAIRFRSALGFSLIEYLAVAEALRGRGLGGEVFRRSAADAAGPVLLEVEAPVEDAPSSDQARRLRFYGGLGCRLVRHLRYRMPRVASQDPPPMRLMLANYPHASITAATLRGWVAEIYVRVYDRRADDPAIDRMFASLPADLGLVEPA